MEHWYVYYKLNPEQMAAWLPRTPALFEDVRGASGVRGRLLRRAHDAASAVTLMEVYEGIADPAAFGASLDAAVRCVAAAAPSFEFDPGTRRVERFCDMPPLPGTNG